VHLPSRPTPLVVLLRRLAGKRRLRAGFVVVVVAVTFVIVGAQMRAAQAARQRWTEVRQVAVARHDLRPGATVDAAAVELRELPARAIPEGAVGAPPVGAVVRYPVVAGEPILTARLAPDGLTGVAALLPPGHRAVAVAVAPTGRPPLEIGDRVDVLTAMPSVESHDGLPSGPLVEGALVVDIAPEAVTVAVPATAAPAVAFTVAQGGVVLALTANWSSPGTATPTPTPAAGATPDERVNARE
jgi:Flp pilus assembly protein CpaB